MDDPATDAPEWSPPVHDEKTNVAMQGGYPLNFRLRAEALAADGKATDPESLIEDDLIADAAGRLEREKKAADEAARNAPSMKWTEDKLRKHAATIPGLVIPDDYDKADILKAIESASGASQTEA